MFTWLFLSLRILANPLSNVFQKHLAGRQIHPLLVIAGPMAILALACSVAAPILTRDIQPGFWLNIWICAILAIGGNVLIVEALRRNDLSILGPINAYKPIVNLLPSIILLQEWPNAWSIAGIAAIALGSHVIVTRNPDQRRGQAILMLFRDRGVQFRLLALILSSTEATFLKRALQLSSPTTTFVFWAILGFAICLILVPALMPRPLLITQFTRIRRHLTPLLLLGLTTGIMQLCTLLTFNRLPVAQSLALFQISTLLTVLLGHHIFKEPHLLRRLTGALIMIAGAVAIGLSGQMH